MDFVERVTLIRRVTNKSTSETSQMVQGHYIFAHQIDFVKHATNKTTKCGEVYMASNIRVPQQERSIEKKNKIIQAGYQLFSEVGYYGTNTAEIAKRA